MKTKVLLIISLWFPLVNYARITYEQSINGAMAKVVFRIVDQDGEAVAGAKIWGGFSANRIRDSVLVDGTTNADGEFEVQGKCNEFLRVDVTKDGYYHTEVRINFLLYKSEPVIVDGKWQPYGEVREVVLKQIKRPWSVKVLSEDDCKRKIPEFGGLFY